MHVQAIAKASIVLRAFNKHTPEWGVRELAMELAWPRSSTHAHLQALAQNGFLRRTNAGRYRLSWKILELTEQLHHSLAWFDMARHAMQRIATHTHSLGVLCVLENESVICIDRFSADPELEVSNIQTDVYLPANATASGKILFAHANMPAPKFIAYTSNSITTPDEWQTELDNALRHGIASSIEEWLPGKCALAIPVFFDDEVVAALALQLPLHRFMQERNNVRASLQRLRKKFEG